MFKLITTFIASIIFTGYVLAASITPTIIITVVPVATGIDFPTTSFSGGPTNSGKIIGPINLTMNPAGGVFTGTLTLGGTAGQSFVLTAPATGCTISGVVETCTNASTNIPIASVAIGTTNLATGSYVISLVTSP